MSLSLTPHQHQYGLFRGNKVINSLSSKIKFRFHNSNDCLARTVKSLNKVSLKTSDTDSQHDMVAGIMCLYNPVICALLSMFLDIYHRLEMENHSINVDVLIYCARQDIDGSQFGLDGNLLQLLLYLRPLGVSCEVCSLDMHSI